MLTENINPQQSRSGSRDCGHHVGTDVLPGRDQPTELMRDFNRMAEPIEGLVDSQSQWSLWELVEQVAHDAEYETPARGCRVTATADAADNVMRNSTRYTAEGTTVEVRLERQQAANRHEIVVRVLDSGAGVPDEALPNIFEPFYRLDDARNRQTGGAGLGLSIADRAIRLHGGQLRASNRKEGGLAVEIRIPAAPGFALPAHS